MKEKKVITLNKINEPKFYLGKIDEDYDLIKIICNERWPPRTLLNKLADELSINSVMWIREKEQDCIYLLTDKGKVSIYALKSQATELDKYVSRVIKKSAKEVDNSIIMNLFWNKLCAFEAARGSNLLGKLYITYQNGDPLSNKRVAKKYSLLETYFSRDLGLEISEKSFIPIGLFYSRVNNTKNEKEKKYAQERLDKIKKRQLYEFKPQNNTIKQVAVNAINRHPKMNWFVRAPLYTNKKNVNTKFIRLDGQSDTVLKNFEKSKSGISYRLLNIFNHEFSKYLKENITFQTRDVDYYRDQPWASTRSKHVDKKIADFFAGKTIKVTNHAAERPEITRKEFTSQIRSTIIKYCPKVKVIQKGKSNLNINLINQPSYYSSKDKDKHVANAETQNITIENWLSVSDKNKVSLIKNSLKELMVKNAIEINSIKYLFDTKNDDELEYYRYYSDTDTVLKYSSTGDMFKIENIAVKDSPFMQYKLIEEDQKNKISRTDYECLIWDKETNSLMGIKPTSLFTLPNLALYKELSNRNPLQKEKVNYRRIDKISKYLSGLVDLNYWTNNDRYYYNVGTSAKGVDQKISKASIVREITMINGVPEDWDKIRSLIISMNTFWVKFKELSVLPFPVKLMNEYYLENNSK